MSMSYFVAVPGIFSDFPLEAAGAARIIQAALAGGVFSVD